MERRICRHPYIERPVVRYSPSLLRSAPKKGVKKVKAETETSPGCLADVGARERRVLAVWPCLGKAMISSFLLFLLPLRLLISPDYMYTEVVGLIMRSGEAFSNELTARSFICCVMKLL